MVAVDARLEALRVLMHDAALGAMVVWSVPNVSYLTGFIGVWDEEPAALLAVTDSESVVFTDSRYLESARAAALEGPWDVRLVVDDQWSEALAVAVGAGATRVAVESTMPYATVEGARERFEGDIVPTAGLVERLRASKDANEIELIGQAQAITDAAFDHVLGFVRPGMTEREVALELEFHMRATGSDGIAFPPIVASGPNSALPHAHPSAREIVAGDFLKMDFGARVGGYCADMTRTVVVGTASARQREIYQAVLAANAAGLAAVAEGVACAGVDKAARDVLAAAGYGDYFGHGLGHGLGLEIHEQPSVGARSTHTLAVGNVVTIEPGAYLPGFGGVRIEDLVVVDAGGARVLTTSTKDLIEL
ncbi:MAG: aminopeptidase P family protein [Coriobacteriia bacterium]|nr:aminopeptidase P family protein [Coriobacteriia bacterium]